jgi:hypothetical protein
VCLQEYCQGGRWKRKSWQHQFGKVSVRYTGLTGRLRQVFHLCFTCVSPVFHPKGKTRRALSCSALPCLVVPPVEAVPCVCYASTALDCISTALGCISMHTTAVLPALLLFSYT